jgi:hypothetical protein
VELVLAVKDVAITGFMDKMRHRCGSSCDVAHGFDSGMDAAVLDCNGGADKP